MTHLEDRCAFSAADIRAAEAPLIAAHPTDAIMLRAAWAVADVCRTVLRGDGSGSVYGSTAAAFVGAGDNGGDALYALAALARDGAACHALLFVPDHAHPRAVAALRRAGGRVHDCATPEALAAAFSRIEPEVVVDGIVGLGASGPPRPQAQLAAQLVHASDTPVVAVDLPSGLEPDTGFQHEHAIVPLATVTFGLWRRAHLLNPVACGRLFCAPIGLDAPATPSTPPLHALGEAAAGALWPVPGPSDDKYTQGVVAIRAGSTAYPGAAVLCTGAAVAATSPMVRYAGPAAGPVLAARPEVVAAEDVIKTGKTQAWVVGPGAGTGPDAVAELTHVLDQDLPTVVDADALSILAAHPAVLSRHTSPLVLTPHAGEFARLAAAFAPHAAELLDTDRAAAVRALVSAVAQRGVAVTVLLKGRLTLVDDGNDVYAQHAGTSWAATPGSGDVLSGVIGAVLAAHSAGGELGALPVARVVAMAQVAHSVAARIAARSRGRCGAPIGASDLLDALPAAIAQLRSVAQ